MNLKDLFINKEYNKVIDLTNDTKEASELFIRASSFVQLAKYDEAIKCLEDNASILEANNPFKMMKLHMELLIATRNIAKAKEAEKHYQNLPYISQEVEEYLADLPNRISECEHGGSGEPRYSYDEIDEVLMTSTNNGEIAKILFTLEDYNLNKLIPTFSSFFVRGDIHPNLRTYGLILLVQNRIDETFNFLKGTTRILVNPSKLNPPFNDVNFKKAFNLLNDLNRKEPSLNEIAIQIFNNYILDTYPDDVLNDVDMEALVKAIDEIAKEYLQIPSQVDDKAILEMKIKIKQIIEETPALVF